ncbi:MAG: PfkB family carbohydrate kinase [Pseudomonadota bacterium]
MTVVPGILCVGAAHWDIIGRSFTTLTAGGDVPGRIERRPGGVALNIAVGLVGHGCAASLCSIVGRDDAGAALIRRLEENGVDCSGVLTIAGAATDQYMAIEDRYGDLVAAIADATLLERNADALASRVENLVHNARSVVFDANLSTTALRKIAQAARDADAAIIANPVSPVKAPRLEFLLSETFAPTIIANLAEANAVLKETHETARGAAHALQVRSGGSALVTNGAGPIALATPSDVFTAMPPALSANTSVTGAGDALLAAFLASPDRHSTPGAALRFALDAAARHMKVSTI